MLLEEALSNPIPLAEAASFFLKLKTAAEAPAAAPPDETGDLEGQFAAPVEQVLKLMGEMVENELKTMYAYHAYAASLRDLSHFAIAKEFEEHGDNELDHADFLLRRMTVLGGPITLSDIPAPPATTDPNVIVETMIRMEQEGIEKWRALHAMLGDNPTRFKVEEFLSRELEHLDELWQLRQHQGGLPATPAAPAMPAAPADAVPAVPAEGPAAAAVPKLANMAPVEPPNLPASGKGQNAVPMPTTPLPATAQGQNQKLALAIKGFSQAEREAVTRGLGKIEKRLQGKKVGILRQVTPDLKTLAERPSAGRMKAAEAFKLALAELQGGAPEFQQYVDGEQAASQAQEHNELGFYRQKMTEAFSQLEAQKAQAEQTQAQVGQLQQQIQQTQGQQEQYQQMVSQATESAVSARDETLREQQASAAMRMAYQKLRGDLLNAASQEPPSTEMLAEQAAMTQGASATPGPVEAGPAGQAPSPGTPPGSPAPQGDETTSAPAAGQEPQMQNAQPATAAGQQETAKTSGLRDEFIKRAPYALGGAAFGAGAELAYKAKSSDPLREKVKRLEGQPEGSFGRAIDLAQAKARLALSDAVDKHPKAALLSGMVAGGLEGALGGPGIAGHIRKGVENVKKLRA